MLKVNVAAVNTTASSSRVRKAASFRVHNCKLGAEIAHTASVRMIIRNRAPIRSGENSSRLQKLARVYYISRATLLTAVAT